VTDQAFDLGYGRLVGRTWAPIRIGDIIERGAPEQVTAFTAFMGSRQPRARRLERRPRAEFRSATDQLFQGERPGPGFGLEKHRVANVRPLHGEHQIGARQVALEELPAQLVWERNASRR
jgi:hypothetical protein